MTVALHRLSSVHVCLSVCEMSLLRGYRVWLMLCMIKVCILVHVVQYVLSQSRYSSHLMRVEDRVNQPHVCM